MNACIGIFCRFKPERKTRPQAHVPGGGSATHRLWPAGPTVAQDRHGQSAEIEPVGVHHLGPGLDEVAHELLLMPLLGIDFGRRAQLRV